MKTREIHILNWLKTGISLLLMVGVMACEDQEEELRLIDENNFYEDFTATNLYDGWDIDRNTFLNESEFSESFYEIWDFDKDGMLEASEWETIAIDYSLPVSAWQSWDFDADGILQKSEFETGFALLDFYNEWDMNSDGQLMDREYTNGVFANWDTDGDGFLVESEYTTWFDRYYRD